MKELVLLIGLMMGSSLCAFGQGRDTAFAVHKLFSQKRGNGQNLQSFRDSSASKAYRAQQAGSPLPKQEVRQQALGNTAFTVAGMVKSGTYSVEEEAYVLRQYAAGQPIPARIRKKLRRKHFHVSAHDIVSRK